MIKELLSFNLRPHSLLFNKAFIFSVLPPRCSSRHNNLFSQQKSLKTHLFAGDTYFRSVCCQVKVPCFCC